MSHSAQLEYLKSIYERYHKSNKLKKSQILTEFCAVCGVTRKHAIRLLKPTRQGRLKRSGPRVKYDPARLVPALRYLWRRMGRINSKKLKAALPEWLEYISFLDQEELFTDELKAMLKKMSASTLERMLRKIRWKDIKGKAATRSNRKFMNKIPIQAKDWNVTTPGVVQADTVAHCGDTLMGAFAYSLTVTDIFTGWTENRAIWTKGTQHVIIQLQDIESKLPFKLSVFKSDSGSEFMSHQMRHYLETRSEPIKMVRSRPYRKDDNCYVEQKNFTHVRELFGYDRIPSHHLVRLMNEIYCNYWSPLQNYFIPSTKLLRKTRIGARIKKEFEPHKTPYQRVLDSTLVSQEQKNILTAKKGVLNPFELSKGLEEKLREFFKLLRQSSNKVV